MDDFFEEDENVEDLLKTFNHAQKGKTARPSPRPFTCGRCANTWTGLSMAHCGAPLTTTRTPLTMWDGDTRLLTHRYAILDETPIDRAGGVSELFTDLRSAHALAVKLGCDVKPWLSSVDSPVLLMGDGQEIAWVVVGPIPVYVVNLVIGRDAAGEDPVLVGLDVVPHTDAPPEQDVSMAPEVSVRFAVRDQLTSRESTNVPAAEVYTAAPIAPTPLGGTLNADRAVDTDDVHTAEITLCCHHTFGSVKSFDRHRGHGGCAPPPLIGLTWNTKRGVWSEAFTWDGPPIEQARAEHPTKLAELPPSYNQPGAPRRAYLPKTDGP